MPGIFKRPRAAGALVACALAAAALAAVAERGEPDADTARRIEIGPDDARAHRRALDNLRGPVTPESLVQVLKETRREAGRVGPPSPVLDGSGLDKFARVPGNAWVNLGPTGSAQDDYGAGRITTQSGRMASIVPHPTNPDILYLATSGGGVWKTYNATASKPRWEPITDNLGSLAIGALAMDPASPELLYLGLGDTFYQAEPGITYSRDGGATWADPQFLTASYTVAGKQVSKLALSVRDIKIDPSNSAHVLAATDVGLFASTNAGGSWSQVSLADGSGAVNPYEIWSIAWTGGANWLVTGALPVIDTTTFLYPGSLGLWRSTDNGAHWTFSNASLPTQQNLGRATFAVAPSTVIDPPTSRIYMLTGAADSNSDQQRDVFRSDDGGATFVALNVNATRAPTNPVSPSGFPSFVQQLDLNILSVQAYYNQSIAVDPRDPDLFFIGGQLTHARSRDAGSSWSLMSHGYPFAATALPYVHPDHHAMAISTAGGTAVLWVGTDGGLTRSTDAFTAADNQAHYDEGVNTGIVTMEPYSVACAPETWPDALQGFTIGGTQDNGTRQRQGNSTLFDDVIGGDGTGVAVSMDTATGPSGELEPAVVLGGPFHRIYRSVAGKPYDTFSTGLDPNTLPEIVPYAVDKAAADPQTFLTVTQGTSPTATGSVYQSVGGQPWKRIAGTVHYQDGSSRPEFSLPGSTLGLRVISAYPKKAGVYGATSNRYTFVTSDGGLNWYASINVALNDPLSPMGTFGLSGISFDASDATFSTFWVSARNYTLPDGSPVPETFGHVFKTTDKGATWTAMPGAAGSRLPNVPATGVLVDPGDPQSVYVATRAGLYRSSDGGQHWGRFGTGLPLAEVSGMCLSPASASLKVSLWGRGFWALDTRAQGNFAGVRGNGDMKHHLKLDGFDLIDLVATMGATQADDRYRWEADLVGTVNQVDDADLTAFLGRFGGTP